MDISMTGLIRLLANNSPKSATAIEINYNGTYACQGFHLREKIRRDDVGTGEKRYYGHQAKSKQ